MHALMKLFKSVNTELQQLAVRYRRRPGEEAPGRPEHGSSCCDRHQEVRPHNTSTARPSLASYSTAN